MRAICQTTSFNKKNVSHIEHWLHIEIAGNNIDLETARCLVNAALK